MRYHGKWLLAVALAVLLAPTPILADDGEAVLSGKVEVGAAGTAISDSENRVNEYSTQNPDPGVTGAGKMEIDIYDSRGIAIEGEAEYRDNHDQDHRLRFDLKRVLRNDFSYQVFEHQLDHDRMDYLDAAVIRGSKSLLDWRDDPSLELSGDFLPPFLLVDEDTNEVIASNGSSDFSGLTTAPPPNTRVQQTGGAMLRGEDLVPTKDFKIVYREWENKTEFQHPALPNLTFDLSARHQEREGTEQSIGMGKCSGCHVTGKSREVDEVTEDITAGVTGKFGLFTLRYAFTDRTFNDKGNDPSRIYDPALSPGQAWGAFNFDNRLGYDYRDGELPYDITPDSEKQSHQVKARIDLANETVLVGNYMNTEIESKKFEEPGIFTLGDTRLETTYDIYGLKAKTRFGALKLTVFARAEELENDDVAITFEQINPGQTSAGISTPVPESLTRERESVITRDVLTAGIDAVYRLGMRSIARLGYEYEEVDRENHHFGKTETNTVKASLNLRPARSLNTRLSYTYKDIDNPFHLPHAADVPPQDNPLGNTVGSGPAYGDTFYAAREADLSNQPEEVHEAKLAATWAPAPTFAATVNYRYKDEENDLNRSTWEQETHSPGLTMWYAPSERMNLTFGYNYFDQRSKTAFCQGYYDG